MKLSDFKKPTKFEVDGPEGSAKPYLLVRASNAEYLAVTSALEEAEWKKVTAEAVAKGDAPPTELPNSSRIYINTAGNVGPYLYGWGNITDDDGSLIPDRLADGSLNVEGGYKILIVEEILDWLKLDVAEVLKAKTAAMEAARGNFERPSPVN